MDMPRQILMEKYNGTQRAVISLSSSRRPQWCIF